MTATRLFGTDGVRGVAGEWPLDPPTVARLGAALVRARPSGPGTRLVVGRDTRESGGWIEQELARGARSEGGVVTSGGVLPTPAVAYVARAGEFDLGVVLSASHNPFADNGIKVFSGQGEKFGDANERRVEAIVADESWRVPDGPRPDLPVQDFVDDYLAYTRRLLPDVGALAGARIALDLANGATSTTAARLCRSLGFEVVTVGDRPDGRNINLQCGSTHPAHLAAAVVSEGCRLGVAFDGDGDRAIFVDARGRVVDGDAVLLVIGAHAQACGRLAHDTVVATVMSNIGLEIALKQRGIRMLRTPVGDKYVMEEMLNGGYVLGGEQSGHVILAEHLPTGDGLATALAVMRVMAETGRELEDLAAELETFPQTLVNVRVKRKTPIDEVPAVREAIEGVEAALGDRGRVLVRYSGTERLLRIMIEGPDQKSVQAWAEEIAESVRASLA